MVPLYMLFEIKSGSNLDFIDQKEDLLNGVNFISRQSFNNGVYSKITPAINKKTGKNIEPCPGHTLTVAMGGVPLFAFYQKEPYYHGQNVACLIPKYTTNIPMMIFYKLCIEIYRDNFNYNHTVNKFLPYLEVPDFSEIPAWVKNCKQIEFGNLLDQAVEEETPNIDFSSWKRYKIDNILAYHKGYCGKVDYKNATDGQYRVVSASSQNNGYNGSVDYNNGYHVDYNHRPVPAGLMTITKDGECWDTFYQHRQFVPSINVYGALLNPKYGRKLTPYIVLFLKVLFEKKKINYGYDRKLNKERLICETVLLPSKNAESEPEELRDTTNKFVPDWDWIEHYMKTLYCSKALDF